MNQSMQTMYKTTSSHPTSEDEGDVEQASSHSKPEEQKEGENFNLQYNL